MNQQKWSNWSGSLTFSPGKIFKPLNAQEVKKVVLAAREMGKKVRVAGAGHSSSPLVQTDDFLISMENFKGVISADTEKSESIIGTGMTVKEAGMGLLHYNLSMHNTGDVDVQTVTGAIATGTHGTGVKLKNLSSMLIGCTMVNGEGKILNFSAEKDPQLFKAMGVSLGSFGIMTEVKLKLLPAFKLVRKEWCTHIDKCLQHLDELIYQNRNFDFYWYPRCDLAKLRTLNEEGKNPEEYPFAKKVEEKIGYAAEVLPKERDLKFDEMEYALPLESGPECFQEVRKIMKKKWRKIVCWRVLYRTIAADDFYLSPFSGGDKVTISLHQNAGFPFWEFFKDIEPVFRNFGGKPHWGKKHTLKANELKELYPDWLDFHAIRKKMDPDDIFVNDHLKQLFYE
jgi:FAD/FMN-containing dehydrogenase